MTEMIKKTLTEIRHIAEFIAMVMMIVIFRIIGLKNASKLSGIITRLIGKRHRAHRIAYGNMTRAMPEVGEKERVKLLDKMWMSLGGIIGEYIYVSRMSKKSLDKIVKVDENSLKNIKRMKSLNGDENKKQGGIIFSAHIGNWDVGLRYLRVSGVKVNALYRPLNNRYVDNLMCRIKEFDPIPKGRDGIRDIIDSVKRGEYVIIMADQRVTDGEMIKFFHKEALTATSIARIAIKYKIDLIPAKSFRVDDGIKFQVDVDDPLDLIDSGNIDEDVTRVTMKINEILEKWIRKTPSQWFWVHNRWK